MTVEVGSARYSFDVSFENGVSGLQKIDKQIDNTNKNLSTLDSQTKKTGTSLNSIGRNAGQAGIQVQQFVGQIQGGQDAMLALSAQAADLGIVLGAPLIGSIVGIAAAFGGALIPSLSTGSDELERLIEKLDELEDKSGISVNQTKLLIQEKQKEAKAIGESTAAVAEQIITLQRQLDLMQSAGTGLDTGQFAIPRSAEQNQARYAESIVKTQAELVELRAVLDDNNSSLISVNNEITDLQTGNSKASEELDKLISRLEYETNIIGLTERGIALYTAEVLGATEAQKAQINAKYDLIEAQQLEIENQKEAAAQLRQETREREALANRVRNIGLTQTQSVQQRYENELSLLRQAKEQELITIAEFAEREKELQRQKSEEISRLNNDSLNLVNWESFENRAAGALASGLAGFQDMDDAVRMLGQSLITEALGSLIKYGIKQAAISAGFITSKVAETAAVTAAVTTQAAAATAATAATTTAGVASGAAIAAAMAPAAAASSIATAGAAPAAAAPIAISTTGAIIASIVGGLALAGARQFGGPVSGGKPYLVGERGPEIVVPSGNSNVISNKDAFGGGGIGNVEVYISGVPSDLGKPSASVIDNKIKIAFNNFYSDISEGKGPGSKAFRAGTNLRFQSNR